MQNKNDVNFFFNFFQSQNDDYPIISNHKSFRQFGKHYQAFWAKFIDLTSDSILYDEIFQRMFHVWMKSFSMYVNNIYIY